MHWRPVTAREVVAGRGLLTVEVEADVAGALVECGVPHLDPSPRRQVASVVNAAVVPRLGCLMGREALELCGVACLRQVDRAERLGSKNVGPAGRWRSSGRRAVRAARGAGLDARLDARLPRRVGPADRGMGCCAVARKPDPWRNASRPAYGAELSLQVFARPLCRGALRRVQDAPELVIELCAYDARMATDVREDYRAACPTEEEEEQRLGGEELAAGPLPFRVQRFPLLRRQAALLRPVRHRPPRPRRARARCRAWRAPRPLP